MEYWDYSVEIECLKGPQGWLLNPLGGYFIIDNNNFQIFFLSRLWIDAEAAAELGRTLLERNRELESTIRQQQIVIDDQAQEMQVKTIMLTALFPI